MVFNMVPVNLVAVVVNVVVVVEVIRAVVDSLDTLVVAQDNLDTLVVASDNMDTLADNLVTLVVVLDILDTLMDNLDTLGNPIQALVVWDNLDTHMVGVACHRALVVVAKLDRQSLMMVMELQSST